MHRLYYSFAIILIGLMAHVPSLSAQAAPTSSWLKPQPPKFNLVQPDIPHTQLPTNAGRECTPNTKFILNPKLLLPPQPETSNIVCGVQTAFGMQAAGSSLIRLNDSSLSGPVKTAAGTTLTLNAIPNSRHILFSSSGFDGSHLYLVKDFSTNINIIPQPNGSVLHQLKPGVPEQGIKDAKGNMISFYSTYFSGNGKWMIGEVPHFGLTRVNIETGETLMFGPVYNHQNGIRPGYVAAISADGRYVFAAEHRYDIFKIYDLATCIPDPDQTKTANCQSKDLLPAAKSQINRFTLVQHAQFSTNYALRLHIQYDTGQYGYFSLVAAGEKESLLDYLALGDSFASGEGAHNYKPGTDVRNPFNKCHLSLLSYPYLLAAQTNINSTQSVACSGAHIKDIHYPDQQIYNTILRQSYAKESDSFNQDIYSKYLPGYRLQTSFVRQSKPAHVTVSIAGNDIGFGKIILACLKPGTCYTDPQDKLNLIYTINSKFDDLVKTYSEIKDQAQTGANIYVLGYPLLSDPEGNCGANVHINKQELLFTNQLVVYLNSVIKTAADKAGASYIDVEQAFAGHRLCETVSSNIAVNGMTAGDDKTFSIPLNLIDHTLDVSITGRESFHPNQMGHRLYAVAIAQATNNFARKNPLPALTIPNPNESNTQTLLADVPASLTPKRLVFEDSLTNNLLLRGKSNQIQAKNLQPQTAATIWLRTDSSINLGAYTSSNNGSISTAFTVPSSIKPGFYPIELHTKNIVGEDIIIQKTIYIAASSEDIDGDNILNQNEKCLATDPANLDFDQDAIDDACDNFIDKKPLVITAIKDEQNTNTLIGSGRGGAAQSSNFNTPLVVTTASSNPFNVRPNAPPNDTTPLQLSAAVTTPQILGVMAASHPTLESATVSTPKYRWIILAAVLAIILLVLFLLIKRWRNRD